MTETINQRFSTEELRLALEAKILPCNHKHVLVACMPKSGSTYLAHLIAGLPDMHPADLVLSYGGREQELSLVRLLMMHHNNYVAQHHTRFSSPTAMLLRSFSVVPVVLVRNLFDIVVSLADHIRNYRNEFEGYVIPMAYVERTMLEWEEEKLYAYIIDMILPWYFNFYVSWKRQSDILMLTYDDVIENSADVLNRVAEIMQMTSDQNNIEKAVKQAATASTRKNIGISGRGERLSGELRDKIKHMSSYYPNIDFSSVGL